MTKSNRPSFSGKIDDTISGETKQTGTKFVNPLSENSLTNFLNGHILLFLKLNGTI